MKKFLSLVLALIMTMSLVTISAGATEYKDLTDKDEIQYEEAVAVLNRIGVITGYEDGSFRPETELTRGAAAKIIVSLMIGPDAASALPNNQSPYPDVPAGHTFAGVIGFCKTSGYISGYGDGTFKPANPLTGYAFAKMLLGAVGYKANIEGFVDTGWTMNVARIGNVAGLFDRLNFDGAKAVTRDEACQLALNTLKATLVDYGGTNTVISSSGEVLTVQGSKAQYVTSNNRNINANINRRVINAANNEMTLEFGEEHFQDLRLEHDKYDPAFDVYGHPSNEWSYKKVTIGTFPLPADFTFTKQMAHLEDTVASKEKALGLRGYDTWSVDHRANNSGWSTPGTGNPSIVGGSPFDDATQIIINGWDARADENGKLYTWHAESANGNTKAPTGIPTIAEICDLTDNGVTVEVYVCPVDADFITHVVVTRTQLMEVKRVASDYVALDQIDSDSKGEDLVEVTGYNDQAIDDANDGDIIDVKDNNYDAYNVLKELKAGDKVAVIPYTTDDGRTWEVGEAYVPEEVSGTLTKSTGYATSKKADGNAITVTVGGTEYPIAQWNKDLRKINADLIKATRKDVTLLLDKMGNALLAKDVGNADDWMIVCDYYQAPASNGGKVVWFAHGKSLDGKEDIDVNLGTIRGDAELYAPGSIVHYDIANSGTGEYELHHRLNSGEGAYEIGKFYQDGADLKRYNISSKNQLVPLRSATAAELANGIVDIPENANFYGKVDIPAGTSTDNDVVEAFTYQPGLYSGVKFIFVDFDKNGEVTYFVVKDGPVNVDWEDLIAKNTKWENIGTNDKNSYGNFSAEAYTTKKGEVKAVVIKTDAGDADLTNIILTTDTTRDEEVDTNGVKWHGRKIVRGSDSFKSEDTVLLDKFTEVGEFSRVVKETEENGTKKLEVKGLGDLFENGSVEPIKTLGVTPAQNVNGSINNKIGFRVGQAIGHTVKDLGGQSLTAANAFFMDKIDIINDAVVGEERIAGLIRVDSKTQWLDLREIQDDRIDSLEELVDDTKYDLDKIKLSILMNADKGSDGFRHAYMVAVIDAPTAKNSAKQPSVDVTAALDATGAVIPPEVDTRYTFKASAGAAVYLVGKLNNSGSMKDVTWSWENANGKILSKENDITVNAPKVVGGDPLVLTLKVTNTDKDADKGYTEKTETVTVTIEATKDVPPTTGGQVTLGDAVLDRLDTDYGTDGIADDSIGSNGAFRFNVQAPEWVSDTATLTVGVTGFVDGKTTGPVVGTASRIGTSNTFVVTGTIAAAGSGTELTAVVDSVTWSSVKAKYQAVIDGKTVDITDAMVTAGGATTLDIPTTGSFTTLKFQVDATKYTSATTDPWKLASGWKDATTTAATPVSGNVSANSNTAQTITITNGILAVGNDYVVVEISSGLTVTPVTYTMNVGSKVTAGIVTGDAAVGVSFTATQTAGIATSPVLNNVIKAHYDAAPDKAFAYTVSGDIVDVDNADTVVKSFSNKLISASATAAASAEEVVTVPMNGNYAIKNVVVTPVTTLALASTTAADCVEVNGTTVNITFDRNIEIKTGTGIKDDVGGNAAPVKDPNATGAVLQLTLTGALTDGKKITIAAGAIEDEAYPSTTTPAFTGNGNKAITITFVDADDPTTWTIT